MMVGLLQLCHLATHSEFKSKTENQHFNLFKTQIENQNGSRGGRRQSKMVALSRDSPTLTGASNVDWCWQHHLNSNDKM